jgi:hypothetical protein
LGFLGVATKPSNVGASNHQLNVSPKAAEAHVAEIRARVVGCAALQTRSAAEEAAFQACVSKEIILEVAGILYFQLTCIQRISKDCVDVHIEKYCNRRQH